MGLLTDIYGGVMNALNPAIYSPKAAQSLQLEQLRTFDFCSIPAEVGKLFTARAEAIKKGLKLVSLAHRVGIDGSGQLVETPLIEFSGVSPTVDAKVRALLAKLELFDVLQETEQAGVLQQSYLVGSWFDSRGEQILVPFLPYQVCEIVFNDPWARAKGDIARADRVVLTQPIDPPSESGWASEWSGISLWVAKVVLTRTEAYLEYPDGEKFGLLAPDLSNPLGRIPLVFTRRVKPTKGTLPPIAEDVLSTSIGLILGLSDCENTMRSQAHVKLVAAGEDLQLTPVMPNSADEIIALRGNVSVTAIHLQPQIEKYIRAIETTIYFLYQSRYLRPEAYAASIVTGAARREDAAGFNDARRGQENRVRKLIRESIGLIVAVANTRPAALPLTMPEMSIELRYLKTRENELQHAQSLSVLCSQGFLNIFQEVAREEGLTMEQAKARVKENLEAWRSLFPAQAAPKTATPGLDKLKPEAVELDKPSDEDDAPTIVTTPAPKTNDSDDDE